jgi:predicted SAM-dependent methyltransferase
MLHVAPESGFQQPLQQALGDGYVSADFARSDVKVKVDITDMQFADNSFDVICCSHVLEHVSDDRKAMREFRRVLKPEGWALIMVPIFAEVSFEDPAVVDPAERLRLYGQEDHVRAYGADFVNRLRESGLHVDVFDPPDLYSVSEIKRMGLGQAGTIFRCQPK